MGREYVGQDSWAGKKVYKPAINVPSELVPMAPAGSDAPAYYLEQALRIVRTAQGACSPSAVP
eukprot:3862280-Alexandrium_andersonii.AAC.1